MKSRKYIGMCCLLGLVFLFQNVMAESAFKGFDRDKQNQNTIVLNTPPVAKNDTFIHSSNCDSLVVGDLLANDFDPNGDPLLLLFAVTPCIGEFSIAPNGKFSLTIPKDFLGEISFDYYIYEQTDKEFKATATVYIQVLTDYDCDDVSDVIDLDFDNDGLTNKDEGNGFLDSDQDNIPDCYDIDSDNDGITDNIEWQSELSYIPPKNEDVNKNGWDDAYDLSLGGTYYAPEDTNDDGIPDMLDHDSDHDGISDYIEAFDINNDGVPEVQLKSSDLDQDGLDDAFDNVDFGSEHCNATGSNSPLPDFNQNGIRDWRDKLQKAEKELPLQIYPNPVSTSFKVSHPELREDHSIRIQLFSIEGKLILQKNIHRVTDQVSVAHLDNGIYLICIESELLRHTQKLIVNHK